MGSVVLTELPEGEARSSRITQTLGRVLKRLAISIDNESEGHACSPGKNTSSLANQGNGLLLCTA